jgi:hypothetical protein
MKHQKPPCSNPAVGTLPVNRKLCAINANGLAGRAVHGFPRRYSPLGLLPDHSCKRDIVDLSARESLVLVQSSAPRDRKVGVAVLNEDLLFI